MPLLQQEKLPPREEEPYQHFFSATCPVCRAPSPLAAIPHVVALLDKQLARATLDKQHQGSNHNPEVTTNEPGAAAASQQQQPPQQQPQQQDAASWQGSDVGTSIARMQQHHQQLFAK